VKTIPQLGERLPLSGLLINGGGYSTVGEPLTVEDEYEVAWKRVRLDKDTGKSHKPPFLN